MTSGRRVTSRPPWSVKRKSCPLSFAAGFFQVESGVFERGGLVFHEAVGAGDPPPGFEEVVAHEAVLRLEVAEAGEGLEEVCHGR